MKKVTVLLALSMLLLFLAACGSDENDNSHNDDESGSQNNLDSLDIDEDELADEDEVVVVVNSHEIQGKTYNMIYSQMKMAAVQMGEDVDTDEMKEATLDSLIDRELLMQQAAEEDIDITDEKVEEEFSKIEESGTEDIDTLLEQYQITEDDFKGQLRFDLTLDEYKNTLDDVEVTDEELEDYYNQVKEEQEDVPPLDEVEEQFRMEAQENKVMDTLKDKVDGWKEEADIDEKMEV